MPHGVSNIKNDLKHKDPRARALLVLKHLNPIALVLIFVFCL